MKKEIFCPMTMMQTTARLLRDHIEQTVYHVCCESVIPLSIDNDTPLTDVLQHSEMKNVRQQLKNGIWPKECEPCKKLEEMNLESSRLRHIENWEHKNLQYDDNAFEINYLDLKLSNKCNMACSHCGSGVSSLWSKTVINANNDKFDLPDLRTYDKMLHTEDRTDKKAQDFINGVIDVLPTVENLKFTGGEPLLDDNVKYILQYAVDNDLAKNIKLKFMTNATIATEEWKNILSKFKKLNVGFSIDAINETNDFIRWPFKFDKSLKNIKEWLSWSNEFHIECYIQCTVMIYNAFVLDDIIDFYEELGIRVLFSTYIKPQDSFLNPYWLSEETIQSLLKDARHDFTKQYLNSILVESLKLDDERREYHKEQLRKEFELNRKYKKQEPNDYLDQRLLNEIK